MLSDYFGCPSENFIISLQKMIHINIIFRLILNQEIKNFIIIMYIVVGGGMPLIDHLITL